MADEPRDPWEDTLLWPPTTPESEPDQNEVKAAHPGQPEEHRAEIILTVAVISLFPVFGLFAIGAALMAISDLRKMTRGTMDRSGRTQTIAGLTIALVELFIISCAILYWLFTTNHTASNHTA